ncbi:MAG: Bifunctional hemolysin/adenylate cyclase precursor [Syntrophorhabdus sp. PtaU1.Bin050]|nr:MAG: Bifunctional hemolysin/adenylate cyclase precursor [Syntrophorhabdus sp. PtaU1.Bin050]
MGDDTLYRDLYNEIGGGFNTVRLENLNFADVEFSRAPHAGWGETVLMKITTTGETLTMDTDWLRAVERFRFADRDLSWWEVKELLYGGFNPEGSVITGSPGNDSLTGSQGSDTILGGDGDDILYGEDAVGIYGPSYSYGNDSIEGGAGDDILYGLMGNDMLYGNEGDDVLDGDVGNDTLAGGIGNDTYRVEWSSTGHDVIEEEGGDDKIHIAATSNVYYPYWDDQATYRSKVMGDLSCHADGDDLVIKNTITGETIDIRHWFGGDRYKVEEWVFGHDSFRLTGAEIEAKATSGWITGTESGDVITGTDSGDVIDGKAGDDTIHGGSGNDTLYGEDGNDSLDGGMGADLLFGGTGNDTYVFNSGDGVDTIEDSATPEEGNMISFGEGITRNDLTLHQDGSVLTIDVGTNGDALRLLNFDQQGTHTVETVRFFDGSQVPLIDLLDPGTEGNDTIVTGSSDDIIHAKGGDDSVSTGAGNDILDGGRGNDTLDGGTGNDTYLYNPGDGTDTIHDSDGSDVLVLGQGYAPEHMDYRIEGSFVHIGSIDRDGNSSPEGVGVELVNGLPVIETIRFADGSELNLGTLLNPANVLYGTDGFNMITGGSGDNIISAGGGIDYVRAGSGNDRIYGGAGIDTLYGDAGDDTIFGEEGSDVLSGGNGNDRLYGGTGIDVLNGGTGNDWLSGGADTDVLTGGGGNDRYAGGIGNDSFIDTAGSDTYLFTKGDGQDTLTDIGSDTTYQDTVHFDPSVLKETIALYRRGSTLTIGYGDTDTVQVTGQPSSFSGIEKIELDNGLFLTNDDVNLVIQQMTAFAADHGIALTSIADVRANQDLMNIVMNAWHS